MVDKPASSDHEGDASDKPSQAQGDEVSLLQESANIIEQKASDGQRQESVQRRRPSPRRTRDWYDIATILVAALAFGALVWQSHTLDRQTRILERQTVVLSKTVELARDDQRAWVGPARIDNLPDEAAPFRAVIFVQNFGKTPARNARIRLGQILREREWRFAPDYRKSDPAPAGVAVLFPGQQLKGLFSGFHAPTKEEMDAIESGRAVLHRYGEITYDDVFGRSHRTQFADYLERSSSVPPSYRWRILDDYNTAD